MLDLGIRIPYTVFIR